MVAFVTVLLILSAFEDAGFISDDAVMNNWCARPEVNSSAWTAGWNQNRAVWLTHGRFCPGSFLLNTPLIVSISENLVLYRTVHQVANLLALLSVFWLVKELTMSLRAGIVASIAMAGMFCVTTYHDGLLSFGVLMPLVVIFGSLGITFHIRAQRDPTTTRYSILAAVCATASLLTYEFGLAFVAANILIELTAPKDLRRATRAIPFLLLAVSFVTIFLLIKRPGQYEGTTVGHLDPAIIGRTLLIQAVGTIPLASLLLNSSPSFWAPGTTSAILVPVAVALSLGTALHLTIGTRPLPRRNLLPLTLAGLCLCACPPIMTAMSAKYQSSLTWGHFYIGGYLQFSGQAILVTAAFLSFDALPNRIFRNFVKYTLIATIALCAGILWVWNFRTVALLNQTWKFPRKNLTSALEDYCRHISGPVTIYVDRDWLARWENPNFLRFHTNLAGDFAVSAKATPFNSADQRARTRLFLSYQIPAEGTSAVILGQCSSISTDSGGKPRIHLKPDTVRAYYAATSDGSDFLLRALKRFGIRQAASMEGPTGSNYVQLLKFESAAEEIEIK